MATSGVARTNLIATAEAASLGDAPTGKVREIPGHAANAALACFSGEPTGDV
jgi:hypothetical protein